MLSDRLWLTRTESAELIGLGVRQFSDAVQPKLLPSQIRGKGKSLRLWAPAVVEIEIARKVDLVTPQPGDDPLMSGPATENLDRLRGAQADLKELDLAERKTDLVRRSAIVSAVAPALAAFRSGTERVRRQYGNEAGDAVNEMIDDFGDAMVTALKRFEAVDAVR